MAVFRPFAAVRPLPDYAAQVAALPYDVMSSAEARELAQGNPNSFLHVDKAEIDLDPSIDLYDARVYEKARENWRSLCRTAYARRIKSLASISIARYGRASADRLGRLCLY